MTCDVIMSLPWQCGDRDCKAQWHLSNYWVDDSAETGFTVDTYADGDHDDIEESELPSHEGFAKAWREYHQHVADTGDDPLGEFAVARERTMKERWEFRFAPSVMGYILIAARRNRNPIAAVDLPPHVCEYLNLDSKRRVLQDFVPADGAVRFLELFPNPRKWNVQHISRKIARNLALLARDLKRAARRAMKTTPRPRTTT